MIVLIDDEQIALEESLFSQVVEKLKRYKELYEQDMYNHEDEEDEENELEEWLDENVSDSIIWAFVDEIYVVSEIISV